MFTDMLAICQDMGLDINMWSEQKTRFAQLSTLKDKVVTLYCPESPKAQENIAETFIHYISAFVIPGQA